MRHIDMVLRGATTLRLRIFLTLAVALVLVVAACQTGSSPTGSTSQTSSTNGAERPASDGSSGDTAHDDDEDEDDSDIEDEEDAEAPPVPEGMLDYAMTLDGEGYDALDAIYFRQVWGQVLEAALVPSECPAVESPVYPEGYYTGPIIDSHFHMPQLSDDFGGEDDREGGGGVDQELYDAIAEEDRPALGATTTLDEVVCSLRQEGSVKAFTFFPTFQDAPAALVDLAYNAMDRHGDILVPFMQSTSMEISGVTGEVLEQMLALRPGLYRGIGEIGDSPTEPVNLPPDDPFYAGTFEIATERGLLVMFHPGEGDHENLDRALKAYPDVTFIIHGDFVRPYIGDLFTDNENVYYTFNDIFDEVIPMFRFGAKQDFIDAMEANWDQMLEQAMEMYGEVIREHPDRFMWGTDRADIVWNYHADVGQLLVKFARDFIGRFEPEIQEMIGHLNAERILAG